MLTIPQEAWRGISTRRRRSTIFFIQGRIIYDGPIALGLISKMPTIRYGEFFVAKSAFRYSMSR
jgi:hypothetical protein